MIFLIGKNIGKFFQGGFPFSVFETFWENGSNGETMQIRGES